MGGASQGEMKGGAAGGPTALFDKVKRRKNGKVTGLTERKNEARGMNVGIIPVLEEQGKRSGGLFSAERREEEGQPVFFSCINREVV